MKKIPAVLFLLFSCTMAIASPPEPSSWGGGGYLMGGWAARTITYTTPSGSPFSIDGSGMILETGFNVRWTPVSLLAVEATLGADWYLAAKGTVSAMSVAGYSMGQYYLGTVYNDGDDTSGFLALDVYFFVPFLPVNLFAGYKLSFFGTDLMRTIEGTNAVHFGVEIPITRVIAVRVVGEVPLVIGSSYALPDGATVSRGSGYTVQAEAVISFL